MTNFDDPKWVSKALSFWRTTDPERSGVSQSLIDWNIQMLEKIQDKRN